MMRRTPLTSIQALQLPIARLHARLLPSTSTRHFTQTTRIVELAQQLDVGGMRLKPQSSYENVDPAKIEEPSRALFPHPASAPSTRSANVASLSSPPFSPAARHHAPTTQNTSINTLLSLLATQPTHYVTAYIYGRPYLVTVGDQVRLPFRMQGVQPGDVLRLNRAGVLGSRDYTLKGAPFVDERLFECRAVVLGNEAEPMRVMIKKKQRNRRKKHVRSKHKYTILRISELKINCPGDVER